jgi:lipoyl(octanoyl) transferase
LSRLQSGILATLNELGIAGNTRTDAHGIWGRTGQLVACGVAVKNWTTYYGAYINVDPAMRTFRSIESDPAGHTPFSSLSAERQKPVKMATVRATIVSHLASALGCRRYHLYTGHPLVAQLSRSKHESVGRAP